MKHRIFNKGDKIHGLLSSQTKPDILFPIKGIIMDTKWDPVNPKYKVKILKFYDSIYFLKKHFFEMNFSRSFDTQLGPLPLKKGDYSSAGALEKRLNDKDAERFYVILDSVMCVKTKPDLQDLYERIHFYLISKRFKEIRELSTRSFFRGPLSLDGVKEFDVRFKRFWSDKFEKHDFDINKYLDTLS